MERARRDTLRGSLAVAGPRLVAIESPFMRTGDTHDQRKESLRRNLRYLRAAMRDCIERGEAPFASHGLYTQPGVLDDDNPEQREAGILAGFAWASSAEARVVYVDLGISPGMQRGIDHAVAIGQPVEMRRIPGWS
jgi:hypothetical protein